MEKEYLLRLIKVAYRLAYNPEDKSPVLFSGRSLSIVLEHLAREVAEHDVPVEQILRVWEDRVDVFRNRLVESAAMGGSRLSVYGREYVRVREDDGFNATEACRKGPGGYDVP